MVSGDGRGEGGARRSNAGGPTQANAGLTWMSPMAYSGKEESDSVVLV